MNLGLKVIAAVFACVGSLVPTWVWACSVCYGDPNSPMAKGLNSAVLVLLAIIVVVLCWFVALIYSFQKRARAARSDRE